MSARQPSELLYDSEATLRLVDSAIQEMGELGGEAGPPPIQPLRTARTSGLVTGGPGEEFASLLVHGHAEIAAVLDALRQSRHHLERSSADKTHPTHDKLREVSRATETAATDILNGLDRATALVEGLDAYAGQHGEPDERGRSIRTGLRDELFALMGHMQFQDITSQQLTYASAVLSEMEARLANLARIFDPAAFGLTAIEPPPAPATPVAAAFDPHASTQNRAERQAVADRIVATEQGS